MESLNFELERGSMCHVVHGENCECISSENNDMWMQISANGSNVCIQVYPRNIEESYIGKECQKSEVIRYILSCRNEAEALKCCEFLADFINVGYGDFTKHGKYWLVALDLEDINEIFSGGEMLYHRISLGTNENKERLSKFCEECNIQTAQTVFICIYSSPETMLDTFDSIIRKIESKLSDDCNLWIQFVHDDLLNEEIVIHLLYR